MITYLKGDATLPQASGTKLIVHICNDLGRWGKGFVLAISKRWSEPEAEYKNWYRTKQPQFDLGEVQFVKVEQHIVVANMIGQRGIKAGSKGPPIRYEAVESCLEKVAIKAREIDASIHMPRIGCGLAGGRWEKIEPLIDKTLNERDVYVYDFG